MKKHLRCAIMCNGTTFPAFEAVTIQKLQKTGNTDIVLLIINPKKEKKVKKITKLKHLVFHTYQHLYVNPTSHTFKPKDLKKELEGIPQLVCATKKEGYSEYFSPEDLQKIQAYKLDVILRFSYNIIRGEILHAATYGVWSYHHGDEQKYRGAPPCFWEIYYHDPITGVILQRLTEKLDGGIILQKGYFPTISHSYKKNREQVFFGATELVTKVCIDLQNNVADYIKAPPTTTQAPIYKKPTNNQMCKFLGILLKNNVVRAYNYFFGHEHWNVGIIHAPIEEILKKDMSITWCKEKKGEFHADPFGINEQEVLIERFDYGTGKGSIALLKENTVMDILNQKQHLSYPFLLKDRKITYLIPESFQAHTTSMYQLINKEWQKKAELLPGVPLVDPTIIKDKNYFWLFATNQQEGPDTKLFIYYAKKIEGPWLPHAQNPVKIDIESARPAGTPFKRKKTWYRPAQDSSTSYGARIIIHKIEKLTTTEFQEKRVKNIEPQAPYSRGIHTISAAGNVTYVDGKTIKWSPRFTLAQIKKVLKRRVPW